MVYGLETHIIVALGLTLLILLFVTWKDRHERRRNQKTLDALQKQVGLLEKNVRADIRIMYPPLQRQVSRLENLMKALLQDNKTDVLAEIFRREINVLSDVARQVDELRVEIVRLERVRRSFVDNIIPIAFRNPPPDLFADNPYWGALSFWMRNEKQWTCEKCCINLEDRPSDLHAHHIYGRGFNSPQHLKVLCIACHAEEPGHEFMKAFPEYKAFLEWKRHKKQIF